ncbi:MAG: hypothetical protein COV37_05025 [Bdellovibrio sp. CG11_big_fil_rev_8_21_14_0_20_39_38]|nr:MAG: hypothetical protein COW78_10640 [Bdellovibrio sp. CG22_combo_CG10-13_8_21_14_all_39_27]PIR36109.1 MAG: hypothetical protein COV37_05025 [Bdellovibrio sp. CG11_big_fil_rev_8_21_14_0_20_39_38]
MSISIKLSKRINYLSILDSISGAFPEILNTGYLKENRHLIKDSHLKMHRELNSADMLRGAFLRPITMENLFCDFNTEYDNWWEHEEEKLKDFLKGDFFQKSEDVINKSCKKVESYIGQSFESNCYLISAYTGGLLPLTNSFTTSPFSNDPFGIVIVNFHIWTLLSRYLNKAVNNGISFTDLQRISNYIMVESGVFLELMNLVKTDYHKENVPNFQISGSEREFLKSISC